MPRIFISYRRADSEAVVGRIQERLARAFGGKNVFQDVEDIPPGVDFRQYLNSQVSSCDVELVIIGRQWASVTDDSGNPRLNNPNDFVRIEVEYGLNRDSVTVIPVLVNNASMPPAEELPESLHELLFRNAIPIRNNPDFDRDMERLIYNLRAIDQRDQNVRRKTQRRTLSIVGVVTGLLAVAAFGLVASGIVRLPTGVQPTIDPVIVAQNRVQTLTAEAIAALATPTPNLTGTVDAILTQFVIGTQTAVAASYTDTPTLTYTPSNTPTDDVPATASAQAAIDAGATQAQATNDALATANAPTNTPSPTKVPTETPLPTPTNTPSPTIDATGTLNAQATVSAAGTQAVVNAQATVNFGATQTLAAMSAPSLAEFGVSSNAQWVSFSPHVERFKGVAMVLVPKGCFVLSTANLRHCFEKPFWIDLNEVNHYQFDSFDGIAGRLSRWGSYALRPRNNITWRAANSFCERRDARLPSESEWEYAARGPDGLIYPWGNTFHGSKVIWSRNSDGHTWDVGGRLDGASWVGALDMSGNVWEWVVSVYGGRMIRGGSWNDGSYDARTDALGYVPADSNDYIGFRCALDYEG